MANGILFLDGFGHYTDVLDKWSALTSNPTIGAYGRAGGSGIRLDGQDNIQLNLGSVYNHLIVGFALRFASPIGSDEGILYFSGGGQNAHQLDIRITRNGQIRATRNNNSVTIGTSNEYVYPLDDCWHYVEVRAKFSLTVGEVEVRVDGVTCLTLTTVNTVHYYAVSGADWVRIGTVWVGQAVANKDVDDVVITDASVGTFLGDIAVETLLPSGAGSATAWTASTGTNSSCVDEIAPNDDTDYVSSSTVSQQDLYDVPSLSRAAGTVHAVQVVSTARADAGGTHQIAEILKSGSTTSVGTTHTIQTSYAPYRTIWGTDPNNGAWSISTVNTIEAGIRVIT